MKLYERYVNLWTMFTNTLLNEEMPKLKAVDIDELYNFYIHDFQLKSFSVSKICLKLSFFEI
jgi:hypothetical protein